MTDSRSEEVRQGKKRYRRKSDARPRELPEGHRLEKKNKKKNHNYNQFKRVVTTGYTGYLEKEVREKEVRNEPENHVHGRGFTKKRAKSRVKVPGERDLERGKGSGGRNFLEVLKEVREKSKRRHGSYKACKKSPIKKDKGGTLVGRKEVI